jgi:two-component system chemotaxis sensor kinase CheA
MSDPQNPLADIALIFRDECQQFLEATQAGAQALTRGDITPEALALMQRAVHSAKGGAGALGYLALYRFAAVLEDVLNAMRARDIDTAGDARFVVAAAVDILRAHIAGATEQTPAPDDEAPLSALRALLKLPNVDEPQDEFGFTAMPVDLTDLEDSYDADLPWRVRFVPAAADLARGREPILLLRELAAIGGEALEPDLAGLPALDVLDPKQAYVGWTIHVPANVARTTIEDCLDFVSPQACVTIERDHTIHAAKVAAGGLRA